MATESGHLTWLLSNLSGEDKIKLHSRIADTRVGFFGTTPVVQQALTVVATTTSATAAANKTEIDRLYAGLINLGLITTGG